MFRRVEICFPIENKKLVERIRADLDLYLRDNSQAWLLTSDGSYRRAQTEGPRSIEAQTVLLEQLRKPS